MGLLRLQRRRKRPLDCFGLSALAMTKEGGHCEVVVASPKQSPSEFLVEVSPLGVEGVDEGDFLRP